MPNEPDPAAPYPRLFTSYWYGELKNEDAVALDAAAGEYEEVATEDANELDAAAGEYDLL